jgi:predicted ATP-grasp superfamily ATP-dependent carboligase
MSTSIESASYLSPEASKAAQSRIMEGEVEQYKRMLAELNPRATLEQIEDFAERVAPIMYELGLIFGDFEFSGTSRRDWLKLEEKVERAQPWELESSHLE